MIRNSIDTTSFAEAVTPALAYELQQIRRHLHTFPELSFAEYRTSAYIRSQLDAMNVSYRLVTETGVVATIGSGERCVALRADMDALPITENTKLPYASQTQGVMHACGHDMHTTMLLGAAQMLKARESELNGTVLLIFQPGEEKNPGGASLMIASGALESPRPQIMFGQHADPDATVGSLSFCDGAMMASADELTFTIRGKGAHAAQPHKGNDPVFAASGLIHHLQDVFSRLRNPIHPGVLTITSIHGGTAFNVIPEEVTMLGTLRTFNEEWRQNAWTVLEQQTVNYCQLHGCTGSVEIGKGYPPLINDANATAFAREVATTIVGPTNVFDFEPKMWAEDFAYYAKQIPSCFWMLGVRPTNMQTMHGLHHPEFAPSEDALVIGARMLASAAFTFLTSSTE